MRNNASQNIPWAYPPTLVLTFRIASDWIGEAKFCVCDVMHMLAHKPAVRKRQETAYVQTVSENLVQYTRGEAEGARRARELLSRKVYPSAQMAIRICLRNNFPSCQRNTGERCRLTTRKNEKKESQTCRHETRQHDCTADQRLIVFTSRRLEG